MSGAIVGRIDGLAVEPRLPALSSFVPPYWSIVCVLVARWRRGVASWWERPAGQGKGPTPTAMSQRASMTPIESAFALLSLLAAYGGSFVGEFLLSRYGR